LLERLKVLFLHMSDNLCFMLQDFHLIDKFLYCCTFKQTTVCTGYLFRITRYISLKLRVYLRL
jgi:hypothetical protein